MPICSFASFPFLPPTFLLVTITFVIYISSVRSLLESYKGCFLTRHTYRTVCPAGSICGYSVIQVERALSLVVNIYLRSSTHQPMLMIIPFYILHSSIYSGGITGVSIYPIGNRTWKFILNDWYCLSLILMSILLNFLGYWHSHQKWGYCGFPLSRLFPLTLDTVYLLTFLKDSCG